MKNIMIVDDEIFVRLGIHSLLNWEDYGYRIVCEASNGEDAMKKIETHMPDILLTDLMMDKMDGFELIARCREQYPKIKMIVLSNYNDFENVRRAMKLGAEDYIFKLSIKPEEMLNVLNEVSKKIEADRPDDRQADSIVLKNLAAIKTRLIKTAIQQSYLSEAALRREFDSVGLQTDFGAPCYSLYVSVDNFYAIRRSGAFLEPSLMKFSMENILNEIIGQTYKAQIYNYDEGDVIALIQPQEGESEEAFVKLLREKMSVAAEYIRRYLGVSVSASLSGRFIGLEGLKNAVAQNLQAMTGRFFAQEAFYPWTGTPAADEGPIRLPEGCRPERLNEWLADGDYSQVKAFLRSVFDTCLSCAGSSPQKIRLLLLDVYYRLRQCAMAQQIDFDSFLDENGLTLYEAITYGDLLAGIHDRFLNVLAQWEAVHTSGKRARCRNEIVIVKQFVHQNLNKNLTVQMAAKISNMSESYFSHLFKNETGISFVNYVNQARIARAEILLRETGRKISDIAEEVGIDNPNYFSSLFKKLTGKSPNECRS